MADQRDLQARLAAALADNQRLRDEIRHLKALNGVPPAETPRDQPDRTPRYVGVVLNILDSRTRMLSRRAA